MLNKALMFRDTVFWKNNNQSKSRLASSLIIRYYPSPLFGCDWPKYETKGWSYSWGWGKEGRRATHCPGHPGETESHLWAPTAKILGDGSWLVMTAVPRRLWGSVTWICWGFTLIYNIEGAGLSFHKHPSRERASGTCMSRLDCFWLEMEKGKAYRSRTLKSRTSELVRGLLNPSPNATLPRHWNWTISVWFLTIFVPWRTATPRLYQPLLPM